MHLSVSPPFDREGQASVKCPFFLHSKQSPTSCLLIRVNLVRPSCMSCSSSSSLHSRDGSPVGTPTPPADHHPSPVRLPNSCIWSSRLIHIFTKALNDLGRFLVANSHLMFSFKLFKKALWSAFFSHPASLDTIQKKEGKPLLCLTVLQVVVVVWGALVVE